MSTGFLTAAALEGRWADADHRPIEHDHSAEDFGIPAPADGIVARVADRTITVADLDARLAAIYRGPMRPRLPALLSPEGRRVRRWAVQLLITEALVLTEAAHHRQPQSGPEALVVSDAAHHQRQPHSASPAEPRSGASGGPVAANGADPATERAVQEAVAALFTAVTASISVPEDELRRYYDANPDLWRRAGPRPVPYPRARAAIEADLLAAARGAAFDDWLAVRRAECVTIAPGYEHPGDPTTPDFVHRH